MRIALANWLICFALLFVTAGNASGHVVVANGADGVGGSLSAARRLEFEPTGYHGTADNAIKSRGPINGQDALDSSLQVKDTSPRRVGIDYATGDFVVFDETVPGTFHGHVRTWDQLHIDMQNALRRAGMVDRRGNIPTTGAGGN